MAATIKDISQKAQVSIATVSKVLNGDYNKVSDETKERILKIADELDYRPNLLARNLVRKKSTIIGLIVPDVSNHRRSPPFWLYAHDRQHRPHGLT